MKIDINCDLGEGIGYDAMLMPLISSCNIACGGHTGDAKSMHDTLILAKKFGVKIGAHPSFPDRRNFGRTVLEINLSKLSESIYNQIISLKKEADALNMAIYHIKPHGALYNVAARDKQTAKAVVAAVKKTNLEVKLYAPYNSVLVHIAKQENVSVVYEAFIDRRYNDDLTLVSRQHKGAVIANPQVVLEQLINIVKHQKIKSISGKELTLKATTFCIHGDNVKAEAILNYIHSKLKSFNISIF